MGSAQRPLIDVFAEVCVPAHLLELVAAVKKARTVSYKKSPDAVIGAPIGKIRKKRQFKKNQHFPHFRQSALPIQATQCTMQNAQCKIGGMKEKFSRL